MPRKVLRTLWVGLATWWLAASASASWEVSYTLEEILTDAEFAGVIRCTEAGGIVAGYEVVETWKGDSNLRRFRLRKRVDTTCRDFPFALIGDTFVVAASKDDDSTRVIETDWLEEWESPLWWRQLAADLQVKSSQKLRRLDSDESRAIEFGGRHDDLAALRRAATEFCALAPEEQELRRLKSRFATDRGNWTSALRKRLSTTSSLEEFYSVARTASDLSFDLAQELGMRAGERSLPVVEALTAATSTSVPAPQRNDIPPTAKAMPPNAAWMFVVRALLILRWKRERNDVGTIPPHEAVDLESNHEELRALEAILADGPSHPRFQFALWALSRLQPRVAARWLATYDSHDDPAAWEGLGYFAFSTFAAACARDCIKHFSALRSAKDAYVRAGAAIYLALEDPELGRSPLLEAMLLPDDAGAWAALAVATRGDERGIDRALELFDERDPERTRDAVHQTLICRLLILLSNSASASGVDFPCPPHPMRTPWDFDGRQLGSDLRAWWDEHRSSIRLHDPWFAELAAQKID